MRFVVVARMGPTRRCVIPVAGLRYAHKGRQSSGRHANWATDDRATILNPNPNPSRPILVA